MTDILEFNLPKDRSSIIKVIGVGGGGSNAVNHMFLQGIKGVDFILCNTDAQALDMSPVPNKIQLGSSGLGAGAVPSVARDAALAKGDEIRKMLESNTKMLFITAGMGGGTGTGAAPVIAEIAKELGILTVGIVTLPFAFEGRKRKQQAEIGIKELRSYVDTLLVICNDKLRQLYGNLKLSQAFCNADNVLTTAAKGIAEIITETGYINVDFEDVKTVMNNSGVAIMGNATAEGENRAQKVIEEALASPLLNDNDIKGASDILLYISSGMEEEILMDEITEITDYIQDAAGQTAEIIWGNGFDETLGKKISVTLVATGFSRNESLNTGLKEDTNTTRIIHTLNPEEAVKAEKPIPEKEPETHDEIRMIPPKPYMKEHTESTVKASENDTPAMTPKAPERKETIHKLYDEEEDQESEPVSGGINVTNREVAHKPVTPKISAPSQEEEKLERSREERRKKLQGYSLLNTRKSIEELENQPAYVRRAVELKEVKPSNESHVSRYSLFDDNGSGSGPEIRPNNSFLHDNVD
ncbi:MAG: cell division protein FtsZ [Marinilabiliales bacterium]|nr:MAG: cell division protein FtsZ [Marinilabiliales bacterium]